jgi:diguanylate cyclase (GGDEF)-like protein/PAS domain S-box-containing protein/excisionase family DNA binding protein
LRWLGCEADNLHVARKSATAQVRDSRSARTKSARPVSSRALHAVLVEDNPDDAFIVAEMLKDDSTITVVHVSSIREALSAIPPAGAASCVLLDLSLPDADRFEGLVELRRVARHAATVVLTGQDDDATCFSAMAEGAQDYLVKGRITGDILRRSIRYAVERKSREGEWFNASQRFRLAFERSPTGIALISVLPHQHGAVLDANPSLAAMLGRRLDAVIGENLTGLVDPEDIGQFALEMQAIVTGKSTRAESAYRLIGENEMPALCRISGSLVRDSSGTDECALIMFQDVTVEARREQQLGQALDALDKASYGIALLDIAGDYVSLNRAHAHMLGYEQQQLLGRSWQGPFDRLDQKRIRQAVAGALRGQAQRLEAHPKRADGSVFDAEIEIVANLDRDGSVSGLHYFLRDVSSRKAAERAVRISESKHQQMIETANEGVWIIDADGVTTFVNTKFCEMIGATPAEIIGRPASDWIPAGDHPAFLEAIGSPTGPAEDKRDIRLLCQGGEDKWVFLSSNPLSREMGDASGTLVMVTDITSRKSAELKLAHLASHDELTGLPNRAMLLQHLRDALLHSRRGTRTVGLFFIDLDGFKNVNDTLGHQAGDWVLRAVVSRLQEAARTSDLLARFAGDEFAAVCADLTDEHDAQLVAQKLTDSLAAPLAAESGPIRIGASVGIALSHGPGTSAEDMLRDADTAMYQAKKDGGGRYKIFDDPMRKELLSRLRTERDLSDALRRGQLGLVYQPIVSTHDGRIAGCEALARWNHPVRGEIGPDEFIPIAERTGSIVELGEWVLEEACRQMTIWSDEKSAAAELTMWVNVSPHQFDYPTFTNRVESILAATGADAGRLHFEVTETALFDLPGPTATSVIEELRALGIGIALDDFGTGYSSLNHVRRLPISAIKLDRTFVSQLDVDGVVVPIVDAIATMAHSLSISLVAEGVETEQQLATVIAHGCPLAQGFLFARPMTAGDLTEWAARQGSAQAGVASQTSDQERLSIGEAAESLGVSASTIRRWADSGRLGSLRTGGGHRRVVAADVRDLGRRLIPNVKLNLASPPSEPAPRLASLLHSHGEALVASAAKDVYASRSSGWFAAAVSHEPRAQWVSGLADGCRTGDYTRAIRDSIAFFRRADVGGATVLERHLLAERFRVRLVHLLRTTDADRSDLYTIVKLMQSIEHATLEAA